MGSPFPGPLTKQAHIKHLGRSIGNFFVKIKTNIQFKI